MRQEIALEPDGAPVVRPFRSDEGQLIFRYLIVRPGGMAVWVEVPPDALRDVPKTGAAIDRQLRAASLALTKSITAGDQARAEAVDALAAQVEALGEELEREREAHRQALDREQEFREEAEALRAAAAATDVKPAGRQRRAAA